MAWATVDRLDGAVEMGAKTFCNDVRKPAQNRSRGNPLKIGLLNFELGVRNGNFLMWEESTRLEPMVKGQCIMKERPASEG